MDVVPENFRPMCPEKPEVKFKYKGEAGDAENPENAEANNLAAKVEAAIKAKAPQEEIQNILKEAADEEQNEQFSPLKVGANSNMGYYIIVIFFFSSCCRSPCSSRP